MKAIMVLRFEKHLKIFHYQTRVFRRTDELADDVCEQLIQKIDSV
jgi:hypothetical protein